MHLISISLHMYGLVLGLGLGLGLILYYRICILLICATYQNLRHLFGNLHMHQICKIMASYNLKLHTCGMLFYITKVASYEAI